MRGACVEPGMRGGLAIAVLTWACTSNACIWDRDTLGDEARGLPTVLDAIVGRVELNPPLYYEMRLERVSEEVRAGASDLGLLDDAAVACDRLGRSEEGLEWLEKKRLALLRKGGKEEGDDWYRFYANRGTLKAHLWASQTDKSDMTRLRAGISDLERCIEINPDAHFGRERAQVAILHALRLSGEDKPSFVLPRLQTELAFSRGDKKTIEALLGIMSLGSGADSPDILALLSNSTSTMDGNLRAIAGYRYQDLVASGRPVFLAKYVKETAFEPYGVTRPDLLRPAYEALSKNAQEFRQHREEFMLARLKEGRHPDWDPQFWEGYEPVSRVDPDATIGVFHRAYRYVDPMRTPYPIIAFVVVLPLAVYGIVKGVRRLVLRARRV